MGLTISEETVIMLTMAGAILIVGLLTVNLAPIVTASSVLAAGLIVMGYFISPRRQE